MKHIVVHMFETISRTIQTPIPNVRTSSPSRKSRSALTMNTSSAVTSTGSDTWRTQENKEQKEGLHCGWSFPRIGQGHTWEQQEHSQPLWTWRYIQNSTIGPSTHRRHLTVAHEANIRVELYFALKAQRYRHTPTLVHAVTRTRKWRRFCQLTLQDREANEAAATQERLGAGAVENNNAAGDNDDAPFVRLLIRHTISCLSTYFYPTFTIYFVEPTSTLYNILLSLN